MNSRQLSLSLLLMLATGQLVIAQDQTEIIKASDAAFEKGEYAKALPLYLFALEKAPMAPTCSPESRPVMRAVAPKMKLFVISLSR